MDNTTNIPDEQRPVSGADAGSTATVARATLEELVDAAAEYLGQNAWWKDEPRRSYRADYERIERAVNAGRAALR